MNVDCEGRHYLNRLKVIRQNEGLRQIQVARLLGHNSAIRLCDWENEKRMPTAEHLIQLCVLYDKDVWQRIKRIQQILSLLPLFP